MDVHTFNNIRTNKNQKGNQGPVASKDVFEVAREAIKVNITTLGPLVLPTSEKLNFFTNLLFRNITLSTTKRSACYIPKFNLALEHNFILAASKKVLDELQRNLELTENYIEASRRTLEPFGNTSSSNIWYELRYLEANGRVKGGDRIWQLALGSGFKCNSVVWKALKDVKRPSRYDSISMPMTLPFPTNAYPNSHWCPHVLRQDDNDTMWEHLEVDFATLNVKDHYAVLGRNLVPQHVLE